ncbi:putative Response regulator [Nitrospira japonica]|uniref:Putative Response regulator n=1 Tax=Nitrospira japonica TaxID=1325564 RepID=A0A1W1I9G3_9BACT|nr:response regulator [Nitrospira japonica]SLM49688.1 putative Response regulator [Nitrospira japonica]
MPKVLVADDSIAVRKVAERLLTEAGLGVTLAANGEEALAFLSKECPDLIVSDVIMPDKSGYEVCAFVRAQTSLAGTPVLLISGIVNDEVAKQAESCKADGVLKKPFQGTSLKDRVLELLAKRQAPSSGTPQPAVKPTPSPEADQATRVSQEQLETYRRMAAQLKQAEDDLRKERDQTSRLGEKLAQLDGQLGRLRELEVLAAQDEERQKQARQSSEDARRSEEEAKRLQARLQELESKLAVEHERAAQAEHVANELQLSNGRVSELEARLHAEQEQSAALRRTAEELQGTAKRVHELEAALHEEQNRAEQHTQRIAELQKAAERAREFESALQAERQAATQLVEQMNAMEKALARSQETAQQLAREQQRSEELSQQLHEIGGVVTKAKELEDLLQTERERNAVLTRHVSETEQSAQQATKRFEEMAKKLGEIAGLASQLGNSVRRS